MSSMNLSVLTLENKNQLKGKPRAVGSLLEMRPQTVSDS